ncbi:CD276 antigen-like [Seriola lalandi dorsalis]|uniref:CD276 antigen-like n=1 Tax=Seriola lalandi dorsalis TaxID=1841481 RepID=UPI000C6F76D3|nr:CD276 antigen-like [Seriola lalandi dorsalis]
MWSKMDTDNVVICSRFGDSSFLKGHKVAAAEYAGRTRLYDDQVKKGKATLLLRNIKPKDEGTYVCMTHSATDADVSAIVFIVIKATVDKVDLQQVENKITCSSEGIYPEPELTWSTSPPSNMNLQSKTTIQQTVHHLYNIRGFLTVSDIDLSYSCTVSTERHKRRATLFKTTSITGSSTEATIPCTASNTPPTGLVWKFNHNQIILTRTGAGVSSSVSEKWRKQVKSVSESGSLTLQDLSPYHEGTYTCELSDAEETLITNTFLRIEDNPGYSAKVGGILGWVVVAILVLAATVVLVLYCQRQNCAPTYEETPRQNQ